ncbi:PREDICTED: uncharacterized protein LOC108550637 [Eufriesea mexicana]|nr:PREDICTED: uncharacterized protein LOC108550637 [Eufriesea mexicana]
MAVNKLCAAFRQITINMESNISGSYYSYYMLKNRNNAIHISNFSKSALNVAPSNVYIKFMPKTLNMDIGNPDSTIKKIIHEIPLSKYIPPMKEPLIKKPIEWDQPLIDTSFQFPPTETILEKLASKLIKIRRRKLKKHKRIKLRKKMKFVWAKARINRNIQREKLFQAELLAKIKKAHAFNAKQYVEDKLKSLDQEVLPKTYRGEILPMAMIKQFLKEKQERKDRKLNRPRLKLD